MGCLANQRPSCPPWKLAGKCSNSSLYKIGQSLRFFKHSSVFTGLIWPNFWGAFIFSDRNSFWPNIFLDPKYLGHNISLDQNFSSQIFFDPKSFWPNIFWEPICLEPKFFGLIKVLTKLFWPQNFFDSKLFQDNFKDDFTSTKLRFTQLGTTQPQLVILFCRVLIPQKSI